MLFGRRCLDVSRRFLLPLASKRSFVSPTIPLWEKKTMMVPTMGDSITEGTIVEWTAEIGQAVQDGDVVALVETDKVTVEIKAEGDGVVTQQFGSVDDVVEVGSKLYELDTEATGFAAASSSDSSSSAETASETATTETTASAPDTAVSTPTSKDDSSLQHRTPSIHFLGKDGWEARKSGAETTGTPPPTSTNPLAVTTLPDDTGAVRHPMYGRPAFTDEEMEALMAGGATIAPEVAYYSSGAKFLSTLQQ